LTGEGGGAAKADVIRLVLEVEGTEEGQYGDVSIPAGELYFSIPCFGGDVTCGTFAKLSSRRECPVSVRMIGWNTGWRRMESRIAGTVQAMPLEQAKEKDGF